MKNIRDAIGNFSSVIKILGVLFIVNAAREGFADTLSLTSSASYQQAVNVTYSNPTVVGNTLRVTIQIQNTSGTWLYVEQDTSSPNYISLSSDNNDGVYLLGPGGTKTLNNVAFNVNTYLQFNVTTPIGLDFTTLTSNPKPRALFGAMIVDCMTRGLLTFALPANAFDEPFNGATGVVDPLLDNIVSTLEVDGSDLGSAATDLKNRDWVKLSVDFGQIASQIASESSTLQNSISQLLQRSSIGMSSDQVGTFFGNASTWFGKIAEVLDLPAKYTLLHDITISTFGAPTTSWNRFDVVVTAQAPSVSSVSPSSFTGLPIGQTKLVRVTGSGFTGNSTLTFNDGFTSYPGKVPVFVSANELDYNITTGTNQANWTVQVVNGAQTSTNLGHFTVNAPTSSPTLTGSLVVNLSPAGAISAGAQWQVDGTGYNSSGQLVGYLSPGSHLISFKPIPGYTTPPNQNITVFANNLTSANGVYAAIVTTTYALALNQGGNQGSILNSPVGSWNGASYVYSAGAQVQLTVNPNPGYHFVSWGGDLSGSANPVLLTMSGNKSITANFAAGDPSMGTMIVTIQPPQAATAGVAWGFTSNDFRISGSSYTGYPESFFLQLHPVDGWVGPPFLFATITAGQTSNYVATFSADTSPGLLTVTLSPPDAASGGARWHLNGGAAQGNGAIISTLPGTNYVISFDPVPGWTAPSNQIVTITRNQTTVTSGNYVPTSGQPIINAVSPPIGPMSGGATLTINGVNFSSPASVTIGGQLASNVVVSGPTMITCSIPGTSIYGTTPIIVQTSTGSCSNLNGFAYGFTLGKKLDLLGSVGGSGFAAMVNGNYAYVGEGRKVLVLDVSSSSPTKVGQVTLPGQVMGIAQLGNYAYVANSEAGLQVLDLSNPTTPKICGYYASTNASLSQSIKIFGGRAYVADEVSGLEILDLGNPTVPVLISATNCGGWEDNVIVRASGSGTLAYLTTQDRLCVLDVSQPASPVLLGQASMGSGGVGSIVISGNYVLGTSLYDSGTIHIVDVSTPTNPKYSVANTGDNGTGGYTALAAANGYLYAESSFDSIGFKVFSMSGSSLSMVGQSPHVYSDGFYNRMIVNGTRAYITGGSSGLKMMDISNPFSPALLSGYTDSGAYGSALYVAVTGNLACTANNDFKLFDVTQPQQPALLGQLNSVGATAVVAHNGYAFFNGNGNAVNVVRLSGAGAPHVVTTISTSIVSSSCLAINGNVLFVGGVNGSSQPRLAAFDISNPAAPALLSTKDYPALSGPAKTIAVAGNQLLLGIASTPKTLSVLDISNINAPVELSSLTNVAWYVMQMSSGGHYAYILDGTLPAIIHAYDVSHPSTPVLVTNCPLDSTFGWSLAIRGNELFAVTGSKLYVFDISNPALPNMVRSYVMSEMNKVAVPSDSMSQTNNVFVADTDGGLVVLSEEDIQAPDVYITNPWSLPTWTNSTPTINLGGGSDDNMGVTKIVWSNDRGGSGAVPAPLDNWFVSGIELLPGTNVLTVTAFDAAGNSGTDVLTVFYATTNQSQTITFPAIPDHNYGDPAFPLVAAASSGLPVTFNVVSGPAILSNNVLSLTGAGAVTVQANQLGSTAFNPATPVNLSFNVARANQYISFAPIPNHSAGDPPFALTGTTSSGLPVYFNIISGPAIGSNNVVTLLGGGSVSMIAWQPGNSNYNAATPVLQSFNVSKIPQTITFGALSQQKVHDAPFSLYATSDSSLPVIFSVSGPAVLNGNILTLTSWGTVTVTATQSGNASYMAAANVVQSFFVIPPDNTIVAPQKLPNGNFQLAFYGLTGSNYLIQTSTNLVNWQPFTNFIGTNSLLYFNDSNATNFKQRFYRALRQ